MQTVVVWRYYIHFVFSRFSCKCRKFSLFLQIISPTTSNSFHLLDVVGIFIV